MSSVKERVEEALEMIRPALQADGGNIRLVDVKDGVVLVELQGACVGCPMAQMTLRMGVERTIKEMLPEVERVEAVGLPSGFGDGLAMGRDDEAEDEDKK